MNTYLVKCLDQEFNIGECSNAVKAIETALISIGYKVDQMSITPIEPYRKGQVNYYHVTYGITMRFNVDVERV